MSCSSKTTDLIIESNSNVVLGEINEIEITRIQEGYSQINNSNAEYLNYYFFLQKNKQDIPIEIIENKTNNNCETSRINIQNRNILFEKKDNNIFIYVDCIPEVYQFTYENEQNVNIKLIIEDKKFTQIKDSVIFNLKTF